MEPTPRGEWFTRVLAFLCIASFLAFTLAVGFRAPKPAWASPSERATADGAQGESGDAARPPSGAELPLIEGKLPRDARAGWGGPLAARERATAADGARIALRCGLRRDSLPITVETCSLTPSARGPSP